VKKLVAIILLLASPLAFGAGSTVGARIGFIHVMSDGFIYVDIKSIFIARTNAPACSNYPVRYVFDGKTPGGQMMFRSLLMLHERGVRVWVAGTGTCALGGYEIVDYLGIFPVSDW